MRIGPVLDVPYIETVAKAHERHFFDRALLAFHSTIPDALQIGQHVLERYAAAQDHDRAAAGLDRADAAGARLATIDHLRRPRLAARHHRRQRHRAARRRQYARRQDERYARTSEFLDIVRLEWTSEKPSTTTANTPGRKAFQIKPYQPAASTPLSRVVRCRDRGRRQDADTFALWGESYAQVRDVMARYARRGETWPAARASACRFARRRRHRRSGMGKGGRDLARATALQDKTAIASRPTAMPPRARTGAGAGEQGTRIDKRLWTRSEN